MATLVGVLPATQLAFTQLDAYARSMGVSIGVADFGGIRTESDTNRVLSYRQADYNKAVSTGAIPASLSLNAFRPVAPFGQSFHNYGAAFDVGVIARPSNMTVADVLAALGAYAPSIGLRWGGTFADEDPPHFELAIPITQAQTLYQTMTGNAIAGGVSGAVDDFVNDVDGLGGDLSAAPRFGLLVTACAVIGVMWWAIRRR